MSFSIVSTTVGVARLHIEGSLDETTTYILRLELAALLRRSPTRVELSMSAAPSIDKMSRDLLLSFVDVLRAQGADLVLCGRDDLPVAFVGPREVETLFRRRSEACG